MRLSIWYLVGVVIVSLLIMAGMFAGCAYAGPSGAHVRAYAVPVTLDEYIERLATAIYWAEGGPKTRWPYGILRKYKTTTPRQACINTIKGGIKRFHAQREEIDFIIFLSRTYCPIGAANDPTGLNVHWVKNVKYFMRKNRPLPKK